MIASIKCGKISIEATSLLWFMYGNDLFIKLIKYWVIYRIALTALNLLSFASINVWDA